MVDKFISSSSWWEWSLKIKLRNGLVARDMHKELGRRVEDCKRIDVSLLPHIPNFPPQHGIVAKAYALKN